MAEAVGRGKLMTGVHGGGAAPRPEAAAHGEVLTTEEEA
jgi:hypothetical protein